MSTASRREVRSRRARGIRNGRRRVALEGLRHEALEDRVLLTNWTGTIPNGTVWDSSQVQVITGDIDVPAGSTLTIDAGTVIKFNSGTSMTVDGTLNAQGTSSSQIYFTSYRDDAHGGDTNNNGPDGGGNGDWNAITFSATSTGNVLNNVNVLYGGRADNITSGAVIDDSPGTLSWTGGSVANSNSPGIRLVGASPTLSGLSFLNNHMDAVSMDLTSQPVITNPTVSGNGENGVALDAGTFTASESWNNPNIVYWLRGPITVPQGDTLTVGAGQIVKFAPGSGTLTINGTLLGQGTSASPIYFTSYRDDARGGDTNNNGKDGGANGDWNAIIFGSTSTGNVLNNVNVFYGGSADNITSGAVIDDSPGTLSWTGGSVDNSNSPGIRLVGASPTLSGLSFLNNHMDAVSMDLTSQPVITNPTVSGNGENGVALDAGTFTASESWNNPNIVYWLRGPITVPQGDTLTVGAGQIVKFAPGGGALTINGTLLGQGTSASPIYFTSYRDDAHGGDTNNNSLDFGGNGDWNAITFSATSTGNVLNNVHVLYGGGADSSDSGSVIVNGPAPLTWTGGSIENSNSAGIRMVGAAPTLTGLSFLNNHFGAGSMDAASQPLITAQTVKGNGQNAIVIDQNGSLAGNESWDSPTIVYWVSATVTVPAGDTLTVAAGQIIKLAGGTIAVNGTLNAPGTSANPIYFTSYRDDAHGGDTNNNSLDFGGDGDWNAIIFGSTSTGNVLNNVNVLYGGSPDNITAGEVIDDSPGTLTWAGGSVSNSNSPGIRLVGARPTLSGLSFLNNHMDAVSMDLTSQPVITNPTVSGNGENGVALDAGTFTASESWNNPNIVYWLRGPITVPQGDTLTVGAGQTVKFAPGSGTLTINGTLLGQGTSASPIDFTSYRDDARGGDTNNNGKDGGANGDWNAIIFGSTSTGNVLNNVNVFYGGSADNITSGAVIDDSPGTLSWTGGSVDNSNSPGIRLVGAHPTLSGLSFLNNHMDAVSMDLTSQPVITNPTVSGNGENGVALDAGTFTASESWNNPNIVYWLRGPITVPQGDTLTVGAGQIVKFAPGGGALTINGTLLGQGTSASPIYFTSYRDDAHGGDTNNNSLDFGGNGDWNAITFSATSTGNALNNVHVLYGGGADSSDSGSVIVNGPAPLTWTGGSIENSNSAGIRMVGAAPTLTGLSFLNNHFGAGSMDAASQPLITAQTVKGNGQNAIVIDQNGSLAGNESWDSPTIVYWVSATVTVPAGDTLTVAAGQIIKLAGGTIAVNGTLNAQGTASKPIYFTSYRDDAHGGDTNSNGPDGGGDGDWNAITFGSTSTGNVLNNVNVLYGGSPDNITAGEVIDDSPGTLTWAGGSVSNSNSPGIRLVGARPTLSGLSFLNNHMDAVSMDLTSQPVITNPTVSGNGENGVALDAGTFTASESWNNPNIVYWLRGPITVPQGDTLTVGAGQIVKFAPGSGTLTINGTLLGQGTSASPIDFTSYRDDAHGGDTNNNGKDGGANGDWNAIVFGSTSTGNVLNNVNMFYGGGADNITSGAVIDDSPGTLTWTGGSVDNSNSPGIRLVGAHPTLSGLSFLNNHMDAVSMDLTSQPVITNPTVSGNGENGVALDAGSLTASESWNNPQIVYWPRGTITVPAGDTLVVAPGQVVKFPGNGLVVAGTLKAQGTVAAPAIFTSYRDDSALGDTNDNGPDGGGNVDWSGIDFTNTSTASVLNHVEVRFAGGAGSDGAGSIEVEGAALTVSNSFLGNNRNFAVAATSGSTISVVNCVIIACGGGILAEDGSKVSAFNNTMDSNGIGVQWGKASVVLTNNLITNSGTGVNQSGMPTSLAFTYNDVFNPNGTNYRGITDQTGTNHNLSVAPGYENVSGFQYQLKATSQVIDAGAKAGAPTTDILGNSRVLFFASRGDGSGTDMGAYERQLNAISNIDLDATSVASNQTTGVEGQSVTVNWSAADVGTGTATGSWSDEIFLSSTPVLTSDAIPLATVVHTGNIVPGQTYNGSTSVTLPGVLPGSYYFIVKVNARGDVFESNYGNNQAASTSLIQMSLPKLPLGTLTNGTLPASTPSDFYYEIDNVPVGATLTVTLTGTAGSINGLFINPAPQLPSAISAIAIEQGTLAGQANQTLTVPDALGGTYYVLVHSGSLSSPEPYTIEATVQSFGLTSITPTQGSNTGQVAVTFFGAQFTASSTPELIDSSGTAITPLATTYVNSSEIVGVFDLTGHPTGAATAEVINGSATAKLTKAFTITGPQTTGGLVLQVIPPGAVRLGAEFPVIVHIANTGSTDIEAPVLQLTTADLSTLSFSHDLSNPETTMYLVGTNDQNPAGDLPPGASRDITLWGKANSTGTEHFTLSLANYPAGGTIPYASLSATLKPSGLSNAQWTSLFNKIAADIGPTWQDYADTIATDASLLTPSQGLNYSLADVFNLEVAKAQGALGTSVAGSLSLGDGVHPLSNVIVTLTNATTGAGFQTSTLSDGSFALFGVPAGTYNITLGSGYTLPSPQQVVVGSQSPGPVSLVAQLASSISGQIVNAANGTPIAGITVTAIAAGGEVFASHTDASGDYTFNTLPADDYTIEAGGMNWTKATTQVEGLAAGDPVGQVDLALAQAGFMSGTVTGPGGGLAGATVTAVGADGTGVTTTTDASGNFLIGGLSNEQYTLWASKPGFTTFAQTGINAVPGSTVTGIPLALSAGGTIKGTITLAANHAPAPFFMVTITGTKIGYPITIQTDSQGNYTTPTLPAGGYSLTIQAPDFMTTTGTATVSAGAATSLNFAVPPLGAVSGTVLDTSNNPIVNSPVTAIDSNGNTVATTLTGAGGAYQLTGLNAGTYMIVASNPGGWIAPRQVTISPTNLSVTINYAGGDNVQMNGTVFKSDGKTPFTAGFVTLSQGGVPILTTPINSDGTYAFSIEEPGTFQVEASVPGESFVPVVVTLTGSNNATGQNLVAGARSISGTVTAASGGAVVAGAQVTVTNEGSNLVVTNAGGTTTDSTGKFSLSGLVAGSYQVLVSANGFATTSQLVTIGSSNPAPLSIALGQGVMLQGTVQSSSTGLGLSGATVLLQSVATPTISLSTTADAFGNYQFAGLSLGGSYLLTARVNGYQSLSQLVTVSGTAFVQNVALDVSKVHVQGIVQTESAIGAVGVAGATVLAMDPDSNTIVGDTVTARDGSFDLTTLGPGTYTIVASIPSLVGSQPFTITVGSVNPAPLTISLTEGAVSLATLSPPPSGPPTQPVTGPTTPGFLTTVLIPPVPLPNAPTPGSLGAGASQAAIDAVNEISSLFADWQQAVANLTTGAGPQIVALGVQAPTTIGQFALLMQDAAAAGSVYGGASAGNFFNAQDDLADEAGEFSSLIDASVFRDNLSDFSSILSDLIDGAGEAQSTFSDMTQSLAQTLQAALREQSALANAAAGPSSNAAIALSAANNFVSALTAAINDEATVIQGLDAYQTLLGDVQALVTDQATYNTSVNVANAALSVVTIAQAVQTIQPLSPILPPAWSVVDTKLMVIGNSSDTNSMTGPAGFGSGGFIRPGPMTYTVNFENDKNTATAAAETITTSITLDADLDLSTFRFTGYQLGSSYFPVSIGTSNTYQTIVYLPAQGVYANVSMSLNLSTRVLTVAFQAMDPLTGLVPDSITQGVLPINDAAHDGAGFFTYTALPKAGLSTGTQINAQASLTFDQNAAVTTNTVLNTLDVGAPTSSVNALPQTTPTLAIPLSWSGSDDSGGSGIASYAIYVSVNGGGYSLWNTFPAATTSATYTGLNTSTYSFYSLAIDNVGNAQTAHGTPATTTILIPPGTPTTPVLDKQSDTGKSNSDGITLDNGSASTPLVFDVSETPAQGDYFWLYNATNPSNLVLLAGPVQAPNGTVTIAGSTLADGTYKIAAKTSDTPTSAQSALSGTTTVQVDTTPPTSSVAALPATSITSTFTVSWSGSDGSGSGIASYNVFVQQDGGVFTIFQTNTTATSAVFTAAGGHSYGFYSVATDVAGNVQTAPTTAQTTTYAYSLGAPQAPTLTAQSATGPNGLTRENGSITAPLAFNVSETPAQNDLFELYNVTNPSAPVLLAGPVLATNGVVTVAGIGLADGTYKIAAETVSPLTGAQSLPGPSTTITIQTSLHVTSVTPGSGTATSAPSTVVVTFNHALAGLTPDDATGGGFANFPFAVYLSPAGPSGAFNAPSGLDAGDLPVHATLVYHVNSNGTSTVTLTPTGPLGTDSYVVGISGNLTDLAGNMLTTTAGALGNEFPNTYVVKLTPKTTTPLKITSVSALQGTTKTNLTNNATIAQPDTIAITFNRPIDYLQLNNGTIAQLVAGTSTVNLARAVYSPTTQTIYLTPQSALKPGTTYTVKVAAGLTDDQKFPATDPAFSLGKAFTVSFKVKAAGLGAGTGPMTVTAVSGGQQSLAAANVVVNAPLGYVAIQFSEQLNLSSLTRFTARLIPQKGGLSNTAFDSADEGLNALVTYNPNTRTLVVVPTALVGPDTYWLVLGPMKATNGDALKNTNPNGNVPLIIPFTVKAGPLPAVLRAVSSSSRAALDVRVSSALPSGPALTIVPQPQPTTVPPAPVPIPSGPLPTRPLQPIDDSLLGGLARWLLRPRFNRGEPPVAPRWPAGPLFRSE